MCGDLQVASAQTLDFLDIGQKSSFPDWKPDSTAKSFPEILALQKVSSVDLVVDPHVCLCENLQRASAHPLDSPCYRPDRDPPRRVRINQDSPHGSGTEHRESTQKPGPAPTGWT
ncbi:hypothetical protein TRIP_B40099 [uncultured Desulfatiglans sp.]|uniref:Uncharacterized protein n=1 Tax=Uncultured Desulfatiglans sp. TaxID=1748965 RepID=A0A653ADP2_UNCDX|nr:hypothetical protein TRIP_B40099 [uncultured Desulfatiglans sp.]